MFRNTTPATATPTLAGLRVTTFDGDITVATNGAHTVTYEPRPRCTIKAVVDAEASQGIDPDGMFVSYKFVSIA